MEFQEARRPHAPTNNIADFQFVIWVFGLRPLVFVRQSTIGNPKSEMYLAGMTRLELANQLIENQSAFHFAFIPTTVSSFGLRVSSLAFRISPETQNSQLETVLVPAEGFEPTLSSS